MTCKPQRLCSHKWKAFFIFPQVESLSVHEPIDIALTNKLVTALWKPKGHNARFHTEV
jgi:hypothetical protein